MSEKPIVTKIECFDIIKINSESIIIPIVQYIVYGVIINPTHAKSGGDQHRLHNDLLGEHNM